MPIKPGDPVPTATFKQLTASGIANIDTAKLLKGRKVIIFGLPGAYTPVCSASHLPGFVAKAAELKSQGVPDRRQPHCRGPCRRRRARSPFRRV